MSSNQSSAPSVFGEQQLSATEASAVTQSAILIRTLSETAQMRGRSMTQVVSDVKSSFSARGIAEVAEFSIRKGSKKVGDAWVENYVEGPSVHTARELARLYGGLMYGFRVIEETWDKCKVQGFAIDLVRVVYVTLDMSFDLLVVRKDKATKESVRVAPNEAEKRELVASMGARVERNAILQVVGRELTDLALSCAAKALADDPSAQRQRAADAFAKIGITTKQLEAKIGKPFNGWTPEHVTELRKVWTAIESGETTADEEFGSEPGAPAADVAATVAPASPTATAAAEQAKRTIEGRATKATKPRASAKAEQPAPAAKSEAAPLPPLDTSGEWGPSDTVAPAARGFEMRIPPESETPIADAPAEGEEADLCEVHREAIREATSSSAEALVTRLKAAFAAHRYNGTYLLAVSNSLGSPKFADLARSKLATVTVLMEHGVLERVYPPADGVSARLDVS